MYIMPPELPPLISYDIRGSSQGEHNRYIISYKDEKGNLVTDNTLIPFSEGITYGDAKDHFDSMMGTVQSRTNGNGVNVESSHGFGDKKYMYSPEPTRLVVAFNDDVSTNTGTIVANGLLFKHNKNGSYSVYTLKENWKNEWFDGRGEIVLDDDPDSKYYRRDRDRQAPEAVIENLLDSSKIIEIYNSDKATPESEMIFKNAVIYFSKYQSPEVYNAAGTHLHLDWSQELSMGMDTFLANQFKILDHALAKSPDDKKAKVRFNQFTRDIVDWLGYEKAEELYNTATGYNRLTNGLYVNNFSDASSNEKVKEQDTSFGKLKVISENFNSLHSYLRSGEDKDLRAKHYVNAVARQVKMALNSSETREVIADKLKDYLIDPGDKDISSFTDNEIREFLTSYKKEALKKAPDGFEKLNLNTKQREALEASLTGIDKETQFFLAKDKKSILVLNPSANGVNGHRISISDKGLESRSFIDAEVSDLAKLKDESYWNEAQAEKIKFNENVAEILSILESPNQIKSYIQSELKFDQKDLEARNTKINNTQNALQALTGFDKEDKNSVIGIRDILNRELDSFSDLKSLVNQIPSAAFQVDDTTVDKVNNLKTRLAEKQSELLSEALDEVKAKLDIATKHGVSNEAEAKLVEAIKTITKGLDKTKLESKLKDKGFSDALIKKVFEDLSSVVPARSGIPSTTGSGTPSATGSSTPSATGSSTPSATGSSTPSATGSSTPSATGSSTPSATGSSTPSATGSSTPPASGSDTPSATSQAIIDLLQLPMIDNQDKEDVLSLLNQKINGHVPDLSQTKKLKRLLTEKYKTVSFSDLNLEEFFKSDEALALAKKLSNENTKIREIASSIDFNSSMNISDIQSIIAAGSFPEELNKHTDEILKALEAQNIEPNDANLAAVKMAILFKNEDAQNTTDTTKMENPFNEFSTNGINIKDLSDEKLAEFITNFENEDFTNNPANLLRQKAILDIMKEYPEFRNSLVEISQEKDKGQKILKLKQMTAAMLDRAKVFSQKPGFYQLDSSMQPVGMLKSFNLSGDDINAKFSSLKFKRDGLTGAVKFSGDLKEVDQNFLKLFGPIYGENFDSIEDIEKYYTNNSKAFDQAFLKAKNGENYYFGLELRTKFSQGISIVMQDYLDSIAGRNVDPKNKALADSFIAQLRKTFGNDLKTINYSGKDLENPNNRVLVSQEEVYFSLISLLKALSKPKEEAKTSMLNLPSLNPSANQYVNSDYSWTQQQAKANTKMSLNQENVDFAA